MQANGFPKMIGSTALRLCRVELLISSLMRPINWPEIKAWTANAPTLCITSASSNYSPDESLVEFPDESSAEPPKESQYTKLRKKPNL